MRGAVRFAAATLFASRTPYDLPIFGDAIPEEANYNIVFSGLLAWDDLNLMGALEWVRDREARMAPADGGERALSPYVHAAQRWLARAQRTTGTLYHRLRSA